MATVSYQTTNVRNNQNLWRACNTSKRPTRKPNAYEFKGRALRLREGDKPGEQMVSATEGVDSLVVFFRYAEYVRKGRNFVQVIKTRIVLFQPEWLNCHPDSDFVWGQIKSIEEMAE